MNRLLRAALPLLFVVALAGISGQGFAAVTEMKIHLTTCQDIPMPGARVEASLWRDGVKVAAATQYTDSSSETIFTFDTECDDRLDLVITPAMGGGGHPYAVSFNYNCLREDNWIPSGSGGQDPCANDPCCPIRWAEDPTFWQVRYH